MPLAFIVSSVKKIWVAGIFLFSIPGTNSNITREHFIIKGIVRLDISKNNKVKSSQKRSTHNMDSKLFFLVAAFVQVKLTQSLRRTVSGEFFENVTFIHKTFPVPPSTRAIIEVNVSYPDSFAKTYPILGIYTSTGSSEP